MAVFDQNMTEIIPACAMILEEGSLKQLLQKNHMIFFGSGSLKWSNIVDSANAAFINELNTTTAISQLSDKKFIKGDFTDLTYCEPMYIKEFFSS
jgi:tRNA threonylcarbamoyladenosine biosynthesis protein TsaB